MDHAKLRYLESKQSADRRSRSERVERELLSALPSAPRVVEAGAGTGGTVPWLLDHGVTTGSYLGVERSERLVAHARDVVPKRLRRRGYAVARDGTGTRVQAGTDTGAEPETASLDVAFRCGDALEIDPTAAADLLVAQQFMDLVPTDRALDVFTDAVRPGGLLYFPLTFDGETIFQPDHPADDAVMSAYHDAIDAAEDRDSRAGRHLLSRLGARPGELVAVAAADAIVRPIDGGYPHDEAHFLDRILGFVADTVPATAVPAVEGWLDARREQLSAGELCYVGHRYDLLYRVAATETGAERGDAGADAGDRPD